MNTNEKVFELLEQTGLNWTVEKNQLVDKSGKETNSFGIFRKDNGNWLGTVGDRYTTLQNFELAEILVNATEGIGIEIEKGGQLYDGGKVFLQAKLPDEFIGKSSVKRWITTLNSHDGSSSVGFGSSNNVVVCSNSFYRIHGELQKFRHTSSMKERIAIAQKDLRATMKLDEELMVTFKRMADAPLKDEAIERVLRKIFDVSPDKQQGEISSRKKNQINDFATSLNTSIGEQGKTIWALFNGVTRYTNHMAAPVEQNKKLDYLIANGGATISNKAFEALKSFVEESTPSYV